MNSYRLVRPPFAMTRARFDNVALVPASLLPIKGEWQAVANQLPAGTTLIILPETESRSRQALEVVASGMKAKGRRVTTLPAHQFGM